MMSFPAFDNLKRTFEQIYHNLTQPSPSITDPKKQSTARMLSTLYLSMLPLVLLMAIFYGLTGTQPIVYVAFSIGFLMVVVSYILTRLGQLELGFMISTAIGTSIIVIRSVYSEYPHAEIFMLVAVAIGVAIIMPIRYTLLVSAINLIIVAVFGVVMDDVTPALHQDYITHILFTHSLIILLTYYRNQMEDNLSRQQAATQARIELMLSHIPGILWTFNKDLQTTSVAGHGVFISESSDTTIPYTMLPGVIRPQSPESMNVLERVLQGEALTYERDTEEGHYQYMLHPLIEKNMLVGGIGLAIDISERHQAERQAQQLVAAKERSNALAKFIHAASHDIKNPLSTINTSLYMMKRDPNGEKQDERIEVIESQISRLMVILDSFSKMAELERNDYLPTIPTDIGQVVTDLYNQFEQKMDDKPVAIQLHIDDALPYVQINGEMMHRALSNILNNAVNFTPVDGQIDVRVFENRGKVVIEIEDTGSGIAEADLPLVFEPFFRGAAHRPIEKGSTGLGLSIAKRVIDQHKGRISIASAEGAGTTVRISLPTIVSHTDVGEVTKLPDTSTTGIPSRVPAI
ncbi:MAG: hypothetical protein CL607_17160 [Anaerolineaceae bacterium]|nr:hypothetical protein [Anaerolineaceae bacterium]